MKLHRIRVGLDNGQGGFNFMAGIGDKLALFFH